MYVASETSASETIDNADPLGTLVIEPRDALQMNLWRMSPGTASDVGDAIGDDDVSEVDAIAEAVESGAVTETGTVAYDEDGTRSDVLVHEVTAPGLEGVLDHVSGEDASDTEALWALLISEGIDQDENSATAANLTFV